MTCAHPTVGLRVEIGYAVNRYSHEPMVVFRELRCSACHAHFLFCRVDDTETCPIVAVSPDGNEVLLVVRPITETVN